MRGHPICVEPTSASREELRAALELQLTCEHQRSRRRVAVNLMALFGVPLVIQVQAPALLGRWGLAAAQAWGLVALAAVVFAGLEASSRRKLGALNRAALERTRARQ